MYQGVLRTNQMGIWMLQHPNIRQVDEYAAPIVGESQGPVSKENVVGPVYEIKCEECEATHVGKMERSLKLRFNKHRRSSSGTSEVAKHTLRATRAFRGIREQRNPGNRIQMGIYIRTLNPSLNGDGGRYNLPPVWDRQRRGSLPSSCTTPLSTSAG